MPKVSRVRRFRLMGRDASAQQTSEHGASSVSASDVVAAASGAPMSRGQRKRLVRKEQRSRREEMVLSTLKLKHADEQRKQIDGFDAIREALTAATGEDATTTGTSRGLEAGDSCTADKTPIVTFAPIVVGTNRAKKKVTNQELSHMDLVLQHPSYKENPFGTMQEHLRNTLAIEAEEQRALHDKQRRDEEAAKETRKEEKKERRKEFHLVKTKQSARRRTKHK